MKTQNNMLTRHVLCWLLLGLLCMAVNMQKLPLVRLAGVAQNCKTIGSKVLTDITRYHRKAVYQG